MVSGLMSGLSNKSEVIEPIALEQVLYLVGNSVALGVVTALLTYLVASRLPGIELDNPELESADGPKKKKGSKKGAEKPNPVIGYANLLFVCVGLTGVMLLLNNNIVRAFAIFAAIALVRFRIRLDAKSLNASYLFAVLNGMAAGLGELSVAWTITGVYGLLLLSVLLLSNFSRRNQKRAVKLVNIKNIPANSTEGFQPGIPLETLEIESLPQINRSNPPIQ